MLTREPLTMGPVTAVAFDLRQSDPKSRPTPAENLGPGLSLANSAPSKTDAARRSTGPYSVSRHSSPSDPLQATITVATVLKLSLSKPSKTTYRRFCAYDRVR